LRLKFLHDRDMRDEAGLLHDPQRIDFSADRVPRSGVTDGVVAAMPAGAGQVSWQEPGG
jgi:hypothetical protein